MSVLLLLLAAVFWTIPEQFEEELSATSVLEYISSTKAGSENFSVISSAEPEGEPDSVNLPH
jgi:hypothetical protein